MPQHTWMRVCRCSPVKTRHKRPAVRNWQRAGLRAAREWIGRHGDADGLGVCMGKRTGLVEVDVDEAGPTPLAEAIERFGETPVVIGTPSGKHKLWYRDNGEGRYIRRLPGLPVDFLGGGFTASYRPDLGRSYGFLAPTWRDCRQSGPVPST
jgi:Bifunctional DNA primase/polymerase, N-terminal